jgi:hypothetical protein
VILQLVEIEAQARCVGVRGDGERNGSANGACPLRVHASKENGPCVRPSPFKKLGEDRERARSALKKRLGRRPRSGA